MIILVKVLNLDKVDGTFAHPFWFYCRTNPYFFPFQKV